MKKIIKSRIFIFVLTAVIFTGVGVYAANTYKASDVVYNASDGTTTNVEIVLNDIYKIKTQGDATENDILNGKTAVVQGKLITGNFSKTTTKSYPVAMYIEGTSGCYARFIVNNNTISIRQDIGGYSGKEASATLTITQ
mgnify:CR=1 FL=1